MWGSRPRSIGERGFTLLEILIAITLLGFITLGVVSVTQDAMNTKDRTTEKNVNILLIETALARFEWDLSQIYSPLYFSTVLNLQQQGLPQTTNQDINNDGVNDTQTGGGTQQPLQPALIAYYQQMMSRFERNERYVGVSKEGLPIPRFYAPDKNTFEFFTSSNRRKIENTKQSHFAWVRYTLAEQDMTGREKVHPEMPPSVKSLVRYFTADDPYDDKRIDLTSASNPIKGAVLLENVESLEFQYWDLKRRKWETSLRTIENGETVIRGVKMIVTWWDSQGKRSIQRTFRPHWQLVVPQDATQTTTPGATAGAAGGAAGGTTNGAAGGQQGGE